MNYWWFMLFIIIDQPLQFKIWKVVSSVSWTSWKFKAQSMDLLLIPCGSWHNGYEWVESFWNCDWSLLTNSEYSLVEKLNWLIPTGNLSDKSLLFMLISFDANELLGVWMTILEQKVQYYCTVYMYVHSCHWTFVQSGVGWMGYKWLYLVATSCLDLFSFKTNFSHHVITSSGF